MSVSFDTATKKYYAVFSYRDETGTLRWKKKRGFPRKKDALFWEHEESKRIAEEINAKKKSLPTFREVAELYLLDTQPTPSTVEMKRAAYRRHFAQYIDVPVDQITKAQLIEWRSGFNETKLATRSKNFIIQYIKSVFRFASAVYDIPNAGAILKAFPPTSEELNKEMQVWSVEEFNRFLAAVDNPLYRLYFEFIFWTGCRRGEAIALRKEDISEDGYATIRRSIRVVKLGERPTKNRKIRTIKLDSKLFADIQPLLAQPGPYVFGGDTPLTAANIYHKLQRACEKAGVKKIRLHDFRHSHVSILYDHGVSTKAIADRIGDTEVMVMQTYKHLMSRQEDLMNRVIEDLHKSGE